MRFKRIFLLLAGISLLSACGINPADYEDPSSNSSRHIPPSSSDHVHQYRLLRSYEGTTGTYENLNIYACSCGDSYIVYGDYSGVSYYYSDYGDHYCLNSVEIDVPSKFNGTINVPRTFNDKRVSEIGSQAFNSQYIKTISIPSSVNNIASDAFYLSSNLENIYVDSGNSIYKDNGGVLYSKDGSSLLAYPCNHSSISSFSMLSGVIAIGPYAFANSKIYECDFSGDLVTIGEYAFYNCYNIRFVDFLDSQLEVINRYAFENCYNLMQVRTSYYLYSICEYAFYNCLKLVEVYLLSGHIAPQPSGSQNYGFLFYYIRNICTSYSSQSMIRVDSGNNIYYFDEGSYRYILSPYNYYGTYLYLPYPGANYIFYDCALFNTNITSLNVNSEAIYGIGKYAFSKSNLRSFEFGSHLSGNYIGEGAFNECDSLYQVTIRSRSELSSIINSTIFDRCYLNMQK